MSSVGKSQEAQKENARWEKNDFFNKRGLKHSMGGGKCVKIFDIFLFYIIFYFHKGLLKRLSMSRHGADSCVLT